SRSPTMALSLPSVVFGPAARAELIEARDCYSARDAELADCFIAEVDNVFERVATAPPAFSRGLRRRPPRTAAAQLDAISGRGTAPGEYLSTRSVIARVATTGLARRTSIPLTGMVARSRRSRHPARQAQARPPLLARRRGNRVGGDQGRSQLVERCEIAYKVAQLRTASDPF